MKKIREILITVIFLTIIIPQTFAVDTVSSAETEYDTVARNFLKFQKSVKEILSSGLIEANALDTDLPRIPVAHMVNLTGGGYIVISVSRSLTPVKSYSLSEDFQTLPDAFKTYLLLEMEYNIRTQTTSRTTPQSYTVTETENRWNFLLNYDNLRLAYDYTPDTYLLATAWKQGYPFNKFLPEINGEKVLVGCVNIAMAQVVKYHNHPSSGRGVFSYGWNGQQLTAVFYRPYNWENMPNTLVGTEPEYQVDEVARLLRDLGIMNETDFDLSGSSTAANIQGLIDSLGYANTIAVMDNTDEALFFNTLRGEIDAMRPALLSFPGHMTVADGYASDPTGKKIHVNMGWGGRHDDYYYLDQNVEAGGYEFSPKLDIYYNIAPCSGTNCSSNLEQFDGITGLDFSGKFDYPYDADEYEIYLKGDTTISGSRGYINQAFYILLYDSANTKLISDDDTISINLPAGKYRVKISLLRNSGGGYSYDDKDSYTVAIATGDLTEAEKESIDTNLDISPVIQNSFNNILLNSSDEAPHRILIDARDANGDTLRIDVGNTNADAVRIVLNNNVLSILPLSGATGIASEITIRASTDTQSVEKNFVVMVSDQDITFGKTFEVSGIFENQEGFSTHRVVLDGTCTITGYNGYPNQAFYTSVLDTNENTVIPAGDDEINHPFTRNLYYPYLQGKSDRYILSVTCPDADDSPDSMASLLDIDLSGTQKPVVYQGDVNGVN